MGTWKTPWETLETAEQFKQLMEGKWTVTVKKEEEGYDIVAEGISTMFWDEKGIIGSDYLVDLLMDEAETKATDFDAQPLVIKALSAELLRMEQQPLLPKNLQAINIVRTAIGLKPLSKERSLSPAQQAALNVLKALENQQIEWETTDYNEYTPPINPLVQMIIGLPDGYDNQTVHSLVIETKEKTEPQLDFSMLPAVKHHFYERPGLLKICLVFDK